VTTATAGTRAWLIDLDGTLVDSAPDLHGALVATFERFGHDPRIAEADLRDWVGQGARVMIERGLAARGAAVDPAGLEQRFAWFLGHYQEHLADRSRPYPGVVEALAGLRERGIQAACVTNKLEALARRLLEALDLADALPVVVGGDTASAPKPDAAPLIDACRRLRVPLAEALMVGDSTTDVAAARNAGIPVAAVTYGYSGGVAPHDLGADRLVDDLRELLPDA
jgi:phosphoglycolate phosphatase